MIEALFFNTNTVVGGVGSNDYNLWGVVGCCQSIPNQFSNPRSSAEMR